MDHSTSKFTYQLLEAIRRAELYGDFMVTITSGAVEHDFASDNICFLVYAEKISQHLKVIEKEWDHENGKN